jgi:hypothetical protein
MRLSHFPYEIIRLSFVIAETALQAAMTNDKSNMENGK